MEICLSVFSVKNNAKKRKENDNKINVDNNFPMFQSSNFINLIRVEIIFNLWRKTNPKIKCETDKQK